MEDPAQLPCLLNLKSLHSLFHHVQILGKLLSWVWHCTGMSNSDISSSRNHLTLPYYAVFRQLRTIFDHNRQKRSYADS